MPWMILVCLALIIAGGAVLFFEKLRQNDTRVIEQNLSAIANLKSDQINGWLSRNGTNIEVVATSSLIAERVGKWLSHGALPGAEKQKLRNRLEFMRKHFFYRELALLDTSGKPLLTSDKVLPEVSDMQGLLRHALDLGFNRSMQHIKLCVSRRSVADEAKTQDLLHPNSEGNDVGTLEERRIPSADCPTVRP